jgi:hypothetical protein
MHTRAAVALLLAGACLFGERAARAQACCTSTATIFPARLQDSENALVGLRASAAAIYGSFDDQRVLRGQPAGASEIDFGQALLVTARAGNQPVQYSVAVPFVETLRGAGGVNDAGGGLGDLSLSMRWDMLRAGKDPVVPGIAPILSITAPSGTAADAAKNPLGADATGLGALQLGVGLALEQIFGRTLFALATTAQFHASRDVAGVHSQLGPDLFATLGVSYTFGNGWALGGAFTYANSFDTSIDGKDVANTARALSQLSITGAVPLKHDMRLLGSLFFVPPISSVAQNEAATVGLALTLIYGFPGPGCGCANGSCPMPASHHMMH